MGGNFFQKTSFLALVLILAASLDYLGFFKGADDYFYDLSFRLRGTGETSRNILIIEIDPKTLEQLGRWPFRRIHYASLLNRIPEAKVVAMDILLTEPSEDDDILGQAIRRHGRVLLPVLIDDRLILTKPPSSLNPVRTGHVHLEEGIDGVVREVYHTLYLKNHMVPSFSSVLYEMAADTKFQRSPPGNFPTLNTRIIQRDGMNINYSGGPGRFTKISFSDVLRDRYPSSFFKNKICLIGVTAPGIRDTFLTPFSQERTGTPGVEVHAHILNTLLRHNAITIIPTWVKWLSAFCFMVICFPFFLRVKELAAGLAVFLLLVGLSLGGVLIFSRFNIWLPLTFFYFFIFTLFIISYAFKFNDALTAFDRACLTVRPHLRLPESPKDQKQFQGGIKGLLTPRGLQEKSKFLQKITDQLIFEKELTDSVIFSDVQNIILFGPHKTPVLVNQGAQKLSQDNALDLSSLEAFKQGLFGYMIDKGERDRFPENSDSEKNPFTFTLSFPLPEKKFFKVLTSSLKVQGERYPLFLFADITKLKELELLKGHVVSLVSHEIKTPLTSIEGFGELLRESLEGELKEYASIIQNEAERLIRFLNTYLAISRLEGGGQPLKIEVFHLPGLLREVVKEMEPLAADKGLTVEISVTDETIRGRLDRDLTKQCLVNLLENAVKYSPKGKRVLFALTQDQDYIKVQVIDQGIGIQEKDLEKIFEKFYRASTDGRKPVAGSGLGLTFVKEAVEAQGGTISVESRYGRGSTFSLYFPQRDDHSNSLKH